jgi:drug/metabolite transporter (DMT)-like permease
MKAKHVALLVLQSVIWGCYYVASQKAVSEMSVFSVGILIRLLTLILLTAIMLFRGELKLLFRVKGILPRLILIGVMGFLLDLTAFIGLTLSPAGSGAALLKTDIIFVNLISVFIYKEKFTKLDWGYTIVMLFGVLMVMDIDFGNFSFGGKGDIFFILSALFVSINAFLIKGVQHDRKNPAADNVVAYYNNFVTMLLFITASCIMGTVGQISNLATNNGLFIAVLIAGIGQTSIYEVYYYNLRRNPVWIVKVFLLLMPIVAAVISYMVFGNNMVQKQYIGMLIVLLGAFGILLEQKKKNDKAVSAAE